MEGRIAIEVIRAVEPRQGRATPSEPDRTTSEGDVMRHAAGEGLQLAVLDFSNPPPVAEGLRSAVVGLLTSGLEVASLLIALHPTVPVRSTATMAREWAPLLRPVTAAGPSRIYTGFPVRRPL